MPNTIVGAAVSNNYRHIYVVSWNGNQVCILIYFDIEASSTDNAIRCTFEFYRRQLLVLLLIF